jgi:hypothetical protein
MTTGASLAGIDNVICGKGLAAPGGLLNFLESQGIGLSSLSGSPQVENILRSDEAVIRHVFNTRYTALEFMDRAAKAAEIAKRELLLSAVYRMYACSAARLPVDLRRSLHALEVENVLSTLVRLTVTSRISIEAAIQFCEERAAVDDDLLAHVMDPLQQRYLFCYHSPAVAEQMGQERLDTLRRVCRMADRAGLHAWFEELVPHLSILSREAPQFLRSVLLDVWRMSGGDMAGLAFEIAVLDARLFGEMGWESTRTFCSLLRRITSPGCEVLDPFLNDEEVDCALLVSEALHQDELITHFRKLTSSFNTKQQRDLHRAVLHLAQPPEPVEQIPSKETVEVRAPADSQQPWYRSLKLVPQAG